MAALAEESEAVRMAVFIFIVISLITALLLVPLWAEMLRVIGHMQENYRGRSVPQSMGSVLLPVYAIAGGWALLTGILPFSVLGRAAVIVFGLGLVGLLDDMWGDNRTRGFTGHFRRLLEQGEITTGMVKAIAGLLLSFWAVAGLPGSFLLLFWHAVLVALSANFFNLLDLRPGRSLKAFFLLSLVYAWLVTSETGILLLFPCWLTVLAYFPWDLRSWGMLGDAGANVLGGLLGLVVVLTAPFWLQSFYMAALVLFHVLAERVSLTRVIAANPLLNFIDMLGRTEWET
jgi:UDP-GlcNAc:undecaprenyl-phosphate/decaprenyl-phosphate GlcNAc-1-phosphate transferase